MKKKMLRVSLVVLMTFLISGCGTKKIRFNPDFYAFTEDGYIVNEKGHRVSCGEAVGGFAALSKEKILELSLLLKRARVPHGIIEKLGPKF